MNGKTTGLTSFCETLWHLTPRPPATLRSGSWSRCAAPRRRKRKTVPIKKILAAVAACAVIAVAIPLVMPHGSIEAGADNAAPMMDMTADDGAYDSEYMTGAAAGDCEPADGQQKIAEEPKNGMDDLPLIDADQEITLVGQDADDAKAALDEMGIQPTAAENSSYTYDLTEQQAQELGKTVMALYSVEGDLILVLEVTE